MAIIDRQLPFEYTIASISTDVMVPLPAAPAADFEAQVLAQWNAVYDAYNEVACIILGSMTPELHRQFENSSPYDMIRELKSLFEKQAGVERLDMIQTFHACKQEECKLVGPYVLKMKGYMEQPKCIGYVLSQDICVGLILNGLNSDFVGFVRKYSMHNMGKTIGELHALLIEYEKGKGKGKGKGKDKSYIPKTKNPTPFAKEHLTKDEACHYYKEVGHSKRNYLTYLAELIKKKKQVGTANSSSKHNLESTYLWHCHLAHISKKQIEKLPHDGLLKSMDDESFDKYASCLSGKMTRKPFSHRTKRANDLLGIIHTDQYTPPYTPQHNGVFERRNRTLLDMVRSIMNLITLSSSFWDYALEYATRILNMCHTLLIEETRGATFQRHRARYKILPYMIYVKFKFTMFQKNTISNNGKPFLSLEVIL
ncbi:retrotransposon protein, putative, ty1-copia subclass [Tanacetum coccineum]